MRIRRGDAPLARWLAVAALALIVPASLLLGRTPEPCFLRHTVGVPCPTCGGTRALAALAGGRVDEALVANPLVAVATMILMVWAVGGLVATLVPRWRLRVDAPPGLGRRVAVVAASLVLANWIYLMVVS